MADEPGTYRVAMILNTGAKRWDQVGFALYCRDDDLWLWFGTVDGKSIANIKVTECPIHLFAAKMTVTTKSMIHLMERDNRRREMGGRTS